ncbi:MAG: hypothetical protein PUB96_08670 [Helicobacteraceae bacterium]|nr:hypothetical protein [Helicobacteraceae bacterium]
MQVIESIETLFNLFKLLTLESKGEPTFTPAERAEFQLKLLQFATQSALSLAEFERNNEKFMLECKKLETEIENIIAMQKIENTKGSAQAAQLLIQTDAIARSVKDNAAINKSNAIVNYSNVLANLISQNSSNLVNFSNSVGNQALKLINEIDTSELGGTLNNSKYKTMLSDIATQAQDLGRIGDGSKTALIFAPKHTIKIGEVINIIGFSTYGDRDCYFLDDGKKIIGKHYLFKKEVEGSYTITFNATDKKGQIIVDRVTIIVNNGIKSITHKDTFCKGE